MSWLRIRRSGERGDGSAGVTCHAAGMQLHFLPDGAVKPCCMSRQEFGNVATHTIREIWDGHDRRSLVEGLQAGRFPPGCSQCEIDIARDGRSGSIPDNFDELQQESVVRGWSCPDGPVRMEFNLSNACNLRCAHCNGDLSSAIRVQEGRPPLPRPYGEAFFEELREFVPGLRTAGFAGGEPFLERLNFRVFDLIREHNPALLCTINTNATQWSPRIEAALGELDLNPIVSLDGITPATFERVRRGASFDSVMANVERMRRVVERRGGWVGIHYCLMTETWADLPGVVRYAEEHGHRLWVGVVRWPLELAIPELPRAEVLHILRSLEAHDADIVANAPSNAQVWTAQLGRLRAWAALV